MQRVRIPEEMDDPHLGPDAHRHALTSLARANRLLGADSSVRRAICGNVPEAQSVLDLGCGSGALLKHLSDGESESVIVGVDRSEFALKMAEASMPQGGWIAADVRQLPLATRSIDVVVCTLLLHHFDADDAVAVLAEAARVARCAVVVSDLTRSRMAWVATWLTTRVLSRSWVFHVDGPRSVRAAYAPDEMRAIARRAGLQNATVTRQFPFRMLLCWTRQTDASGTHCGL